ncbi:glutathione S-transferase family protein [Zavarzinia aquatilis]|nr:glutathione S-transferase family protein [Zavarzinia aquatilis]
MTPPALRLFGAPCSYYTAKVRSALRKQRLPFREDFQSHPYYRTHVLPVTQNQRIPVLEFADGPIVQDSTEILDHLEARDLLGARPAGVARVVELFVEAYADRAMLRPAMHYRWNFRAENEAFIIGEFSRLIAMGDTGKGSELGRVIAGRMSAYLPPLGITEATIPAIEAQYLALLDALDRHFAHHPYLLGGSPSRADYGLMGPLHAHLGRDPHAVPLMQRRAPIVYRWTERMNAGEDTSPEFPDPAPGFEITADLCPVLDLMAAEFGPELAATLDLFGTWAAERTDMPAGTPVSSKGVDQPSFGPVRFDIQGITFEVMSAGHSLWMLQRVQDAFARLDDAEKAEARALLAAGGMARLLDEKMPRRLGRQGNKLTVA